jgi:hypothetical protein
VSAGQDEKVRRKSAEQCGTACGSPTNPGGRFTTSVFASASGKIVNRGSGWVLKENASDRSPWPPACVDDTEAE